MGGGGFSMTSDSSATNLDRYLVELTGKRAPLVCFIPTASADDPTYIHRFLTAYAALGVRTMVLTLWSDAAASVARLDQADLVVAGGGSTVNLLALWRAHGVDQVLARMVASERRVVLAGQSAGASCWYSGYLTDSFGDLRPMLNGLAVLPGSFCPHWSGEPQRQPAYTDAVADGSLPGGYAVEDGVALHWLDGDLTSAVAERSGAGAWSLAASDEPASGGVIIQPLPVEVL